MLVLVVDNSVIHGGGDVARSLLPNSCIKLAGVTLLGVLLTKVTSGCVGGNAVVRGGKLGSIYSEERSSPQSLVLLLFGRSLLWSLMECDGHEQV